MIVALVAGTDALDRFAQEAGGHRWQRIPPTERHDRVHTSTVTVAVLPEPAHTELSLRESDLEWRTCKGSGAGGQHRNKTESAVVLTHRPTQTTVRVESERSQHQNRATALIALRARLANRQALAHHEGENAARRLQVGSGQRGDKIRTVQVRHGIVTDHRTGSKARLTDYLRGEVERLHIKAPQSSEDGRDGECSYPTKKKEPQG